MNSLSYWHKKGKFKTCQVRQCEVVLILPRSINSLITHSWNTSRCPLKRVECVAASVPTHYTTTYLHCHVDCPTMHTSVYHFTLNAVYFFVRGNILSFLMWLELVKVKVKSIYNQCFDFYGLTIIFLESLIQRTSLFLVSILCREYCQLHVANDKLR